MNNLTLRTLISPYINDVTRGSVLSQADVDNNFIFLKGDIVYTAETIGNIVTLKKFNGNDLSFVAGETFTGGTISGATNFIGGLTADTFSATTYLGLPQDIYVTGGTYLNGTYTFTNNSGGTFNINTSTNYAAGVISGATDWSPTGTGQINLPNIKVALYDNADNIEPIIVYDIASGTTGVSGIPLLTDNDTNYIVIEYNSGTPRYNVYNNDGIVDDSSTVLYMIVYRAGNFVHTLEFGNQGAGLANKLNDRVIMTNRFGWESGLMIGLSGTGVVTLTSGVAWNGANRQVLNQCDSSGNTFFKNYHVGGSWTYTTTGDTFNNTYYDNGTDIVSGTTGKYLTNWYFRGQEINDHLYEVYDTNEYDSIILAEASPEPLVPELISSHAFLVGRIIVGVGETTGLTQTAFGTVFQSSGKFSSTTIHNDLTGIQGGTGGEYYHLTSNEYNNLSLTNIDNDFTSQQTFNNGLSANTISATTYYGLPQDVYVTGGTYSSGTTTFTNNLGNTFDVTGYFTGSTVVPSEIVYFDSTNPNISGTTFDPDIQMSADTLYVSSVDANTWVYSGASYVTYSAATVSNTEFNLNGTSVDAGGNKTAHISRSGSITIGGTGSTFDKFSVFTTSGLKTLTADNLGSVYNNGKGNSLFNNAFGYLALTSNSSGIYNSAFGYRAMLFNLSGNSNSAFGFETLLNNVGGNYNTAIGYASMRTNSTGIANASMGFQALYSNTTGSYNTSNGFAALYNNTTANYNTSIGFNSMYSNTTGTTNVALGAFSLYSNVGNNNNTAIGTNALRLSNGGYDNTALGFQALYSNTVGYSNTALGKDTLFSNTSGFTNVAIGDRTLFSNTSGNYNNGLGYRALYTNTTGSNNIAMGFQALYLNLSGNNNTAIGNYALTTNSTGSNNIAVGSNALKLLTTASSNVGIGVNTLAVNTTGANNIGIGVSALQASTTSSNNIAIGVNSQFSNVSGTSNTSIGHQSLFNNTNASFNTALGYQTLYSNISGGSNTALGYESAYYTTGGSNNVSVGFRSLYFNTAGSSNTSVGYQSMYSNITGGFNVGIGFLSLYLNTTGYSNTAIGYASLYENVGGYENVGVGLNSLRFNTTGFRNVALGTSALYRNVSGKYNTAIGDSAGWSNDTGDNNTAIGFQALYLNTSGVTNVAVGLEALRNNTTGSNNVAIGGGASNTNTIGIGNTAIGFQSQFFNLSGSNLTSIGYRALRSNTTGVSNTALGTESLINNTTGSNNTATGFNSLFNNTTGSDNTATGYQSLLSNTTGNYNTALGRSALYTNTTGNYNVSLGYQALYLNLSGNSNTAIGASVLNSNSTGSNNIGIGTNALKQSTTASNNIGIGINALSTSTTGASNIGIGTSSQQLLTIGISNISIGANSSTSNVTGSANVAIGQDSLYNNTSSNNTAIGYRSGYNLINGTSNTIIGANSDVPSGLTASLVLSDGNGVVKLSADSAHHLFIPTSPSTGTTSDSLLVRTSGGEIKTIPFQVGASNTSYVDTIFGSVSGETGNFAKPFSTITSAQLNLSGTSTSPALVYVRKGIYNETVTLKNNVYIYCEPGVLFTNGGFIDDINTIETKILGYPSFSYTTNNRMILLKYTTKVYMEFDSLSATSVGLDVISQNHVDDANGVSDLTIVGNRFYHNCDQAFAIRTSGKGKLNFTCKTPIFCAYSILNVTSNSSNLSLGRFTGSVTLNAPKITMMDGGAFGNSSTRKMLIRITQADSVANVNINSDLEDQTTVYAGGTHCIIYTHYSNPLKVNINGEVTGNYAPVYLGGVSSLDSGSVIFNKNVSSKTRIASVGYNSTAIFKNAKATKVADSGYTSYSPFYMYGSGTLFMKNMDVENLELSGSVIEATTTTNSIYIDRVSAKANNLSGFFITSTVSPLVGISNTICNVGLDAPIINSLLPSSFTVVSGMTLPIF